MATNEKFTQLPTVSSATLNDIICAVQGGISVQETLAQVVALGINNSILSNAGNPNGSVAGTVYQLCWDTTNHIMYVCTTTGSTTTAVWTAVAQPYVAALTNGQLLIGSTGANPIAANLIGTAGVSISNAAGSITISGTGSGIGWNETTAATQAMIADAGYVANRATLITFTLPTTAAFGTALNVIGKGAGGWAIAQNASQVIQIGSVGSTPGIGGSVASTNQYDSLELICTTANTVWTVSGGVQGNLTIV